MVEAHAWHKAEVERKHENCDRDMVFIRSLDSNQAALTERERSACSMAQDLGLVPSPTRCWILWWTNGAHDFR
jgi:hypothetical protein